MSRRKVVSPIFQGRRFFLMLALICVIGVLMLRAVWLEVYQQEMLQEKADNRQTRVVSVPAYRGMITDRNGEPMAVSSPVESLWCNPKKLLAAYRELRDEYDIATQQAAGSNDESVSASAHVADLRFSKLQDGLASIEEVLDLKAGALLTKIEAAGDKSFLYLGRHLPPELADDILALDLPGVASTSEYRRFYPLAETSGHVVGMTDIDGDGLEGVEKALNEHLAGRNGKKRVVLDGRRRVVENIESIDDMVPGQSAQLSIDQRIQYMAYKALKTQVYKLKAQAGSLVVLDAHSGEILAMANLPSFNPNNRKRLEAYRYRNRAVTDKFEPGSTLKPLTIAAALESRVIGADVEIDTSPGHLTFGKYKVQDPGNYGSISLSTLLAKSSNVGASRVALLMSPRDHWMFLSRVGFGRVPNAGLSGETSGKLGNYSKWGKVDRASHGYGYGLSTSLLQITHAYAPFAASGKLMPATIYKRNEPVPGQQVMGEDTAQAVLKMMESVVQSGGTGKRAMVDGYRVAGKTGTAYKYINGKYRKDKYLVSFVGIAPASQPRLVVAVQIDEPKLDSSGGRAAAPVFSKVMTESLRLLDIPPDNLPEVKKAETPNRVKEGAT
uniref:Peptidoglycan D,D-transpeptidase FtsI n=1 Tax=uncultured Thiotrichaceae bacterium TaxID=298394 RepID=A0A6S6UE26_9GAMM|nr:MAG: Cell division protein FtsI [Peptidoglycan synthetase] (EC [uncultured Thiotrichaceae bacterium]